MRARTQARVLARSRVPFFFTAAISLSRENECKRAESENREDVK